jgi:CheY-like chemotaxis protein
MFSKRKRQTRVFTVLGTEEVDLIISDWIMPEMTGIEFLKACKGDDNIKKIPFIMVTAEAQKDISWKLSSRVWTTISSNPSPRRS